MSVFSHVIVLPRITPAGFLDIPRKAWLPLQAHVAGFDVSLKVYPVSPTTECGVEVVPNRDLFVELTGPSAAHVDLAFRAVHDHIDELIARYTVPIPFQLAAEQR